MIHSLSILSAILKKVTSTLFSLLQILVKNSIVIEMNIVLFSNQDNYFFPHEDERAKHILSVLKKEKGDSFEAGIENGLAGEAIITKINSEGIFFSFTSTSTGLPLFPIELIVGFVRPIQLKRLFRDVASLGVSKLHLVGTELGEKSYMHSKVIERGTAYKALKDGSIQAKSTHITELFVHNSLLDCLKQIPILENDIAICLDNKEATVSLYDYMLQKKPNGKKTYTAIGSERGWSEKERLLFKDFGYSLCSMGKRVLRTETATTVSLGLILQSMGELNESR